VCDPARLFKKTYLCRNAWWLRPPETNRKLDRKRLALSLRGFGQPMCSLLLLAWLGGWVSGPHTGERASGATKGVVLARCDPVVRRYLRQKFFGSAGGFS